MKGKTMGIMVLMLVVVIGSCASIPKDRYNTQKGAVIGAGAGALMGQAIGHDTEGTLIGLAAGTVLGALVGNRTMRPQEMQRFMIRGLCITITREVLLRPFPRR
jgi:uncharacterized protein YcfJ